MHKIQPFSYHSHTTFSDGKNTLEEMVAQAKKLGFTELGVSDHLIVHKNTKQSPSYKIWVEEKRENTFFSDFKSILPFYQKHCEHIRKLAKKENFKLYVGFEVDYFTYNGWEDELKDFLAQLDYDYLISGNHMFFDEKCETYIDIGMLGNLKSDRVLMNEYMRHHFSVMKKAIESGLFCFLAHMDYVRKVGDEYCGPKMFMQEKKSVLDALQKNNVGIEISTKGLRKIGDLYPCAEIINEIAKRKISVVVSDDAHSINELGADFDVAEKAISDAGIKCRLKF